MKIRISQKSITKLILLLADFYVMLENYLSIFLFILIKLSKSLNIKAITYINIT